MTPDDYKPPQFIHRQLFHDPTPNGLINRRYIQHTFDLQAFTTLDENEKQQLFQIVLLVGKKLVSVWKHKVAYQNLEAELIKHVDENPPAPGAPVFTIETSQDLLIEFDEFLVQVKSTLDYLVKVPVPILGKHRWNVRTFGDKGDGVLRAFRRNSGKANKNFVDAVDQMLFKKSKDWLDATITARDKINHFIDGGIPFEQFSVYRNPETGELSRPMWSEDQSISSFLDVIWNNLFRFCEDFTAMVIFVRRKPGLTLYHGPEDLTSIQSPWRMVPEAVFDEVTKQPGWVKMGGEVE